MDSANDQRPQYQQKQHICPRRYLTTMNRNRSQFDYLLGIWPIIVESVLKRCFPACLGTLNSSC